MLRNHIHNCIRSSCSWASYHHRSVCTDVVPSRLSEPHSSSVSYLPLMLVLSMFCYPYTKQSLATMQGLSKLLCTSCSSEGDVRKSCGLRFLCVVGMVLTASLYPVKLRRASERSRVRVREGCECHRSCKCGRIAGQGRAVWVTTRTQLKTSGFMGHQTGGG